MTATRDFFTDYWVPETGPRENALLSQGHRKESDLTPSKLL